MKQDPLHLLCVEPRFPGRLGFAADWLVRKRGFRCLFYCATAAPREYWPSSVGSGLDLIPFNVGGVARESSVSWRKNVERSLCYSYGLWETLDSQRPRPIDVVLGRSAELGSTLYVPVYAPRVPIMNYFDYFIPPRKGDLVEEDGPQASDAYFHWRRSASAVDLLDLENGVLPWTSSNWQRDLYPLEYRRDFRVIHEGIDCRRLESYRRSSSRPRSISGRSIPDDVRVVSFIASSLDRLRGFDRFVALANRLLKARTRLVCVAIGDFIVRRGLDTVFYGKDYRAEILSKTPIYDPDRFWLLGSTDPGGAAELLASSDLHISPSRPYVVSRSVMEASALGKVILASYDPPTLEYFQHEKTALLLDPNDLDFWERTALKILDDPAQFHPLGEASKREAQTRYSQDATLPELAELLNRLADAGD